MPVSKQLEKEDKVYLQYNRACQVKFNTSNPGVCGRFEGLANSNIGNPGKGLRRTKRNIEPLRGHRTSIDRDDAMCYGISGLATD